MRKLAVAVAILAQFAVLAYMAGKRENIRENGHRVFLRTAPIDPRDPFRGDFVRLNYPFNLVLPSQFTGALAGGEFGKGTPVYAVLHEEADGVYRFAQLQVEQPDTLPYIKGRTLHAQNQRHRGSLSVKYGIEQYFVQQDRGSDIEKRRGNRNEVQIPMEIEVALGGDGTAVTRGFRWSRLGMQLEVTRMPPRLRPGETTDLPISPEVRMTLSNVSEAPLTLFDPGPNCGFTLVPDGIMNAPVEFPEPACEGVEARAADRIQLLPGEDYAMTADLHAPRWHVRLADSGQVGEIGELTPQERYRLVYRAPAELRQIDASAWVGEFPSRAFNAAGRVD